MGWSELGIQEIENLLQIYKILLSTILKQFLRGP